MKSKEVFLGGWVNALANLVAICSVGNDEIITWGFIAAMLIILAASCGIRLMLVSCIKEIDGQDVATDWASFGSYSLGAVITTAVTMFIFLISV